ncbi:hypothetical protein Ssi03_09850 [Sphaerisporangium siamense]|uniref:Uncharacterized protein n=1 Tax=Sphaerisporangium siamense TaxID=795645 RepID=A0A7W7GDI5_9ACTN|nr:hypothetical protein [Sphaerisporangium siamense]MBB4705622.1 hypothetical protein [Sphaerisporangium siamense]GII82995.1 hypothetical protein Ssi03_09850 [Sphaerisporangium siamense]
MNRLILVALMAVGVAVGVPATRTSHAAGIGDDDRDRGARVDVRVSRVQCPSSKAEVVMTAPRDHGTAEYSVYRGDTLVRNGLLWPGVQRTISVYVEPRSTERIGVTVAGEGTRRYQVWSRCDLQEQSYAEYRESTYSESSEDEERGAGGHRAESRRPYHYNPLIRPSYRDRLPYTGPPADLWGKVATAGGLVIFGVMLWYVGLVWPRRAPAEPLLRPRPPQAPRRRPGP